MRGRCLAGGRSRTRSSRPRSRRRPRGRSCRRRASPRCRAPVRRRSRERERDCRGHDAPCARERHHRRAAHALSSARLSASTFTRGSPKHAELARSVCARNERADAPPSRRARRRRARPAARAFAGEMCGSSPDADDVTMSDGICPFTRAVLRDHAVHRAARSACPRACAPSGPCSFRRTRVAS